MSGREDHRDDVLLAARGLGRRFGHRMALADVDITLHRGEVLGFLGLNGAGKSTTMQILAGALVADTGTVEVCGHDLARHGRAARRALGYLPQTPPLYDDMLVDEYLALCARLHGVPRRELAAAVGHARRRCGLDEVGARLIRHLSRGYQQRVGIAQAIIHDPAVLILDEPTNGLDPAQIRDVRTLIGALATERAVMVSTHVLGEIRLLATRIAILHQGRIVHDADNRASGGRVRVRFAHPPPPAALRGLAGVHAAEPLADGGFVIDLDDGAAARAAFADAASAAGWGLVELTSDYDALEHLFMRLTAGRAA